MPPRPCVTRRRTTTVSLAVASVAVWLTGGPSRCQAEKLGPPRLLREPVAQPADSLFMAAGLTPFQPADVSSRIRRTLLQYEALTADGAWDDAIALIERLQTESGGDLVEVAPIGAPIESQDSVDGQPPTKELPLEKPIGRERFAPLAQRCQQLLASLPAEGLAAYRARIDRTARERIDGATARLDESALVRLVQEFYASEPAADALLALGELALERGDAAAARRWLSRVHPLLYDPWGRPAGASLVLLDPSVDPAELAAAWRQSPRPEGLPVVNANDDLLPLALSRLALASIRAGDLRRAAAETRLLRGLAPDVEGRLAGRTQPLAEALEAIIDEQASSADRLTHRQGPFAWAWSEAVPYEAEPTAAPAPNLNRNVIQLNAFGQPVVINSGPDPTPTETSPTLSAVVEGLSAFYVERGAVQRLNLATGETEPQPLPGVATPRQRGAGPALGDVARRANLGVNAVNQLFVFRGAAGQAPNAAAAATQPVRIDPSLTVAEGVLYARLVEGQRIVRGPNGRAMASTNESLIGVRIDATDATPVRFRPPEDDPPAAVRGVADYQFAGQPTVRGDRLYIAIVRPGVRNEMSLACYAVTSGRLLWRCDLGSGDVESRITGTNPAPPVVVGDSVYVATNLGAVAAIDASRGRIRWIARYPRTTQPNIRFDQVGEPASPCVVIGDQLIAAPSDSEQLTAWDTGTGAPLWSVPRRSDATIAGVVRQPSGAVVVLAGRRLTSYDTLTGQQQLCWPESPRAGLRGLGAAAVVGNEVFLPTSEAIFAIDPTSGSLTRSPIDLSPVGGVGANLVPTDDGLLVCGPDRLRMLAELPSQDDPEPDGPLSRRTEAAPRGLASYND
ncbi:outer membrane biogenesis protein BamB [Botrimarina colliarenosi]|uniref:Outer membrane biogenesis protein BamB n=1 Tax=Botrimarina colliarenosi TaxID=2528001 RepID=A0A5C6AI70_9BACT|nr:PQQ-binding-like beta-propeller repeat protein [Botrimarina colliarenosi]TWT99742.1 outer membrane biogenesis protein BamB [Botrimarina colliarenosi]